MIGVGIGLPFYRVFGGVDAQAQAHFDRVIADGGLVPSGLSGVNAFFTTVKTIYATSDITTAISVGLDAQVLGYKLGAGAGTTAGQAAQKLYSCSGASGDVVQTTAASQPLLLVHSGANYYWNSGESSNSLQSPSSAANQITGTVDFDFGFEILPSGNFTQGFGKVEGNASGPSYACFIGSSGNVSYIDSLGSYNSVVNISSFAPSAGNLFYVRLTLSGTTVTCFTSLDGTNWTSRGTATVAPLVTSNSSPITFSAGNFTGVQSKGYRLRIYNGLRDSGGALAVDCNPNQYNAANSQTQWVSTSGETWTINVGTATTGYKGVLVDRTITMGDGINDSLESFSPLVSQPDTIYFSNRIVSTGGGWIIDGLGGNRQIINKGGANINLFAGAFDFAAISVSLRNLLTCVFNGASSQIQINNGTATTGLNPGTLGLQNLTIHGTAGAFAEGTILTTIVSNSLNNSTQRTAMYDYIKSINNNAF
jgi:hypothetical protein